MKKIDIPIVCTLDGDERVERGDEWRSLVRSATGRRELTDGLVVAFPPGPEWAARVADLAAREQTCCSFFDFTIAITSGAVELAVRAPAEARPLVDALFGEPAARKTA